MMEESRYGVKSEGERIPLAAAATRAAFSSGVEGGVPGRETL